MTSDIGVFTLFSTLLLGFAAVGTPTAAAEVSLPINSPECVRWAANDLKSALMAKGIPYSRANVSLNIAEATMDSVRINKAEQTFTITASGANISISAGGSVGAMYALDDLVEQVAASPAHDWPTLARAIQSSTQTPFLEVRADNPFIHVYPILLNDLSMWHDYIDMLARNRFNMLDMHGAYDLATTSFPNLYPQLVEVPGYPTAGGFTPEYRAKNLASFKEIVAYARSRGVRVAFMNYSANDNKGGIYKTDPNVTNVPADKLADYTAKAVTILIKDLPYLYMLGFRVGESMQPASFYKAAYIKGVNDAGRRDLRLYTRSWQTTKEQLEPIAHAAHNGFDIEIKFNGEQLGLPYQAMQGPEYGSYSYQDYLDLPADYQIIWQIRANGTHRFWTWENTDFIRRTIRSCELGNARGFTLEPQIAYFSVYPSDYFRSADDIATYRYIWQKYWMWYYAWGRLGYDPTLSAGKIASQFITHYGSAGAAAYKAMQSSGQIVPLAYAYRFVGPDQRDFSPETESGNFDTKKKRARQDLLQFAENKPEDERSFIGIDAYVTDKLTGKSDGRIGPFAVANLLHAAALDTQHLVASAPAPASKQQAREWRLLRADLLSTVSFAQYYVERIHGMTYLDFALRTESGADFKIAVDDLAHSRDAWRQLSEISDAIYKPLSNPLRGQRDFQWSSQLAPMEKLDATADIFWKQNHAKSLGILLSPTAIEQGADGGFAVRDLMHAVHGTSATITAVAPTSSAGIKTVVLWWKPLPSELPWESQTMTASTNGDYTATVPFDNHGLLYLIELEDSRGGARNLPDESVETPYRVIPATPFIAAPAIAAIPR
jgi:hypothetical protein